MKTFDKDGKSTTSSAVDGGNYPDPRHVANPGEHQQESKSDAASDADIERVAHELWEKNGRPAGSAEQFRNAAAEQLKDAVMGKSALANANATGGSVQK